MRGAEVVAARIVERQLICRARDDLAAGLVGQHFVRFAVRKDERDFIGDGIHFCPRHAVVLRLRAAEKNPGICLGIAEVNHGFWPVEIELRRVDINKAVGIARIISPMPRIVMTTVLSVERSMASRCSSVGIF